MDRKPARQHSSSFPAGTASQPARRLRQRREQSDNRTVSKNGESVRQQLDNSSTRRRRLRNQLSVNRQSKKQLGKILQARKLNETCKGGSLSGEYVMYLHLTSHYTQDMNPLHLTSQHENFAPPHTQHTHPAVRHAHTHSTPPQRYPTP